MHAVKQRPLWHSLADHPDTWNMHEHTWNMWEYVGTSGSAAEGIPAGSALWFIKSRRRKTSGYHLQAIAVLFCLFVFLFSNSGVEDPLQNCHYYSCSDETWRLLSQCKTDPEEFMTDF